MIQWIDDPNKLIDDKGSREYKYVRMAADNTLRFIAPDWENDHRSMLTVKELTAPRVLTVRSAGAIMIDRENKKFMFTGYGSTSLGVLWDDEDCEFIEKFFGGKITL